MIYTHYKGLEATSDMYAVEYTNEMDGQLMFITFLGEIAYLRAVVYCNDLKITGKIVYCITRTTQKVIDGMPVKRGRKKKNERTDKIGSGFYAQMPQPTKAIQPVE
jgi:hypothetical protein